MEPSSTAAAHCSQSLRDVVQSGRRLRVMLLGSGDRKPHLPEAAEAIRKEIESLVDVVLTDFQFEHSLDQIDADLAIVFGGDGSILRSARQMKAMQRPVIGVNLGRLGFLADVQPTQLVPMLKGVLAGDFQVVNHVMLRCQVFDGDQLVVEDIGLNELAVMGGPPFSIQNIDLYVDGKLATSYSCDGLIVSTPVGSTAHNLSAGGPIVRKSMDAFVIAPVSPHTLTVRPIVDSADRIIDVVVQEPNESTSAVLDGQVLCRLTDQHRVRIGRANSVFQLIEGTDHNYYQTLREKLGWGGSVRRP